ncbi:MAG: gliding motility-associated ABC transporter ATP-binding subunit GldA [Bacteroidales bacterium]|nr:gliding motility-associated ABC transporter ATP-binding subunit GldA [Bacteroidales bacterium]
MSIIVKNVVKFYGKQKALDDVSFTIDEGKIVGFLGPNGAGKSTMMKIITGFISKTSGEVLVNDMDIDEQSLEVRKIIGYLPENNPLNLEMYVREYLLFVAGIYKLGKNKIDKINEMIELTGLTPEQNKKIGELSKGFRQRLGLAQALLHDPEVLILDEPTSGLDPNQIIEIRELIQRVGKKKTVMLSTHIMQEVEAICDEVIIINQGKIVAKEKIENIHSVVEEETQTIIVEFDKTVSQENLSKINGVQKVVGVEKNKWLFEAPVIVDIRPEIFNFAVKQGLTVLSQQKKEMSLEEVFQQLTN